MFICQRNPDFPVNMAKKTTKPKIEERDYEVLVPTIEGDAVASRVSIRVMVEWEPTVQEWLLTPESIQKIEDTKARHMGLLQPDDLRGLRERLGLTQQRIGELLQIGAKTWTRWESGRQRPSRSVNLLLRALKDGQLGIKYLEQELKKTAPGKKKRVRRILEAPRKAGE